MTDQFQFENLGDDSEQPDADRSPLDRALDDPLDEGYAPRDHWSPAAYGATAAEPVDGKTFEQRLEQEEPDVEDDWDEDVVDDAGIADDAARTGPDQS